MDNEAISVVLEGAGRLGVELTPPTAGRLVQLADELLRWNARVNLTAITAEREVLEKHLLDSLAVLPDLGDARSLLDLGAGAGFPGLPLKIARPELEVTLADSVGKKVAFMKHAIGHLRLLPAARAVQVRAEGRPGAEGLPVVDAVVSRALMELPAWLTLATPYVRAGGRILAMLGRAPERPEAQALGASRGLALVELRSYALPLSGDPRAVAVYEKTAEQRG